LSESTATEGVFTGDEIYSRLKDKTITIMGKLYPNKRLTPSFSEGFFGSAISIQARSTSSSSVAEPSWSTMKHVPAIDEFNCDIELVSIHDPLGLWTNVPQRYTLLFHAKETYGRTAEA
jgi:hypothetical protein